ncbi:MAG: YbjN domain-containing protein [Candidatus Thorarchaeota archaeon]|nr:YbjN domain-containing protein [Candidatus Thorarchaeota archaeon]
MSTTWFIAKEYLKRLDVSFEERGRKTFSLYPVGKTKTEEIEVFPGTNWITLTTRLLNLSEVPEKKRKDVYEKLLRINATLVEISFGVDKKNCLTLRNAIPVTGISYDAFSAVYEAHINGIKLFQKKLLSQLL